MKRFRGVLLGSAAVAAAIVPAAGAQAAVPRLGTFAGKTSQGLSIAFTVRGRVCNRPLCVHNLAVALNEPCSDGSTLSLVFTASPITGDIHVSHVGGFGAKYASGVRVSGQFTSRTFVNGRVSDTTTTNAANGGLRTCSTNVTYTAAKT